MKKQNKFLPLLLILAMMMTFIFPAAVSAATPLGTDGAIVIRPPSGHSLLSDNFNAYQLFDLINVTGEGAAAQYAYEPTPAVTAFLAVAGIADKYVATALTGSDAAEGFRQWLQDSDRTEEEIISLAKDLTANVTALNAVNKNEISKNSAGQIVFENLNYGYYLVTGESTPANADGTPYSSNVISRGMLINVLDIDGDTTAKIDLKADAPKIDKNVWFDDTAGTGEAYNGTDAPADRNDPGWQEWTDINIGQTAYFMINSTVPNMTGYGEYTYVVHDTLSKGLTYVPDSLQIRLVKEGETSVTPTAGVHYTLAVSEATEETTTSIYAGGTKLTVTFTDLKALVVEEGWTVEITYQAVLNEESIVGNPGNPNKAKLEYSNNPNWNGEGKEPTGETPEEEAKVYTFDLDIFKYTGNLTGAHTPLKDAEFQLKPKAGDQALFVIPYPGSDYDYRAVSAEERTADLLLPEEDQVTTNVLVTNSDGKIRIKGLNAGSYELQETKAPVGYNLVSGWITDIVIEKDNSETGYRLTVSGNPENSVNVLNNTGGQLPGTGGIGIYRILGIGVVMAVLLTAAFIIYRRKNAMNALNIE